MAAQLRPTSAHWGSYQVEVHDDRVVGVRANPDDPAAAPVIGNTPVAQHHRTRVARPAVRRRWLEHGPGPDPRRGDPEDAYVEVEWSTALDLLARELERVRAEHGNSAIYGGSYGWGSAGRIHHAQSQLHRFLNTIGGYTRSVNTYSHGAMEVLFPHLIGTPAANRLFSRVPSWKRIREHTELLVSFGGLRVSNTWTSSGGRTAQTAGPAMRAASDAGTEFVSVSPLRDDTGEDLKSTWVSLRPGTDTAVMLGLMHVLFSEGLADTAFLDRYTVGADRLRAYVMGGRDELGNPGGVERSPEWAERVSGVPAAELPVAVRLVDELHQARDRGVEREVLEVARHDLDRAVHVLAEGPLGGAEVEVALGAGARLLGINNRDLATFETRLETTLELLPLIPPGPVVVSESGFFTGEQVRRVVAAGAHAVLVGEALVRAPDVAATLAELTLRAG